MGGKGRFVIRFILLCLLAERGWAHPLRLSISQIEYASDTAEITVSLRLFLTDVNEALVFDPENDQLRLGREDETPNAEALLIAYLNEFFYLKINEDEVPIVVDSKNIGGTGQDTVLELLISTQSPLPCARLRLKMPYLPIFFLTKPMLFISIETILRGA